MVALSIKVTSTRVPTCTVPGKMVSPKTGQLTREIIPALHENISLVLVLQKEEVLIELVAGRSIRKRVCVGVCMGAQILTDFFWYTCIFLRIPVFGYDTGTSFLARVFCSEFR